MNIFRWIQRNALMPELEFYVRADFSFDEISRYGDVVRPILIIGRCIGISICSCYCVVLRWHILLRHWNRWRWQSRRVRSLRAIGAAVWCVCRRFSSEGWKSVLSDLWPEGKKLGCRLRFGWKRRAYISPLRHICAGMNLSHWRLVKGNQWNKCAEVVHYWCRPSRVEYFPRWCWINCRDTLCWCLRYGTESRPIWRYLRFDGAFRGWYIPVVCGVAACG